MPNTYLALDKQRFLVTGASSGIGQATAIALSEQGAEVLLVGRNEASLHDSLALISKGTHRVCPFDLTCHDAIPSWLKELTAQTGALSGLVHCAGIHAAMPLKAQTTTKVHQLLDTNVISSLALAKAFRQRGVAETPASLVLLSSVVANKGESCLSLYSATKGAIAAMTKSLAIELASQAIRVNCIAPGVVHTPMTDNLFAKLDETQINAIKEKHPLGLGTPRDVANAALFLLSPASRWITGTTLTVDGGYTAS